MQRLGILVAVSACLMIAILPGPPAAAQVLKLGDLNTRQIEVLDRSRTVVLIPGGILEEHGPYLPSYTDGFANEAFTQELARAIVARPGWTVVIYPQIPLGNDPANTIGGLRKFHGSYPVRMATLRSVYMDLATELGEAGFRWIFLVHDHGAPNHHKALNQASDYFRDSYGGTMVHLFGLAPVFLCCGIEQKMLTAEQRNEDGFTVHAGAGEQSQLLFLRPELVPPDYLRAPSYTGKDFADLVRISRQPGWTGYYGAPKLATSAMGAQGFALQSRKLCEIALEILDGADAKKIPRYADQVDPLDEIGESAELDHEEAVAKRQTDWLMTHRLR